MDQRAAGLQQQLRQASHTYGEIFKSAHVQLEHAKLELERCKGSLQCVTDEKKRLQDECKQIHVDRQLLTQALIELQHENKTLRASASEQQLTRNRDSHAQVAELTRQLLAAQEALTVEAASVGELEAATQRR